MQNIENEKSEESASQENTNILSEESEKGVKSNLSLEIKEDKEENQNIPIKIKDKEEKKGEEKQAETKSFKEKLKEESESFLLKKIQAGFEDLGIKLDDLEDIEHFSKLSEGQKFLVLENFKQVIIGKASDEGMEEYRDKMTARGGFLSQIKSGFTKEGLKKIWKNIWRDYYVHQERKGQYENIKEKGLDGELKQIMEKIVQDTRENSGYIEVDKEGEINIHYLSTENLSEDKKQTAEQFNKIANEFSRIPYEWSLSTAKKNERLKYQEAKENYNNQRQKIIPIILAENFSDKSGYGDQEYREAYSKYAKISGRVYANQLLNAAPDAKNAILELASDKKFKYVKEKILERGAYSAIGFGARSISASFFGLASVPIATAFVGGWMAKKRQDKVFSEEQIVSRRGGEEDKIITVGERLKEIKARIKKLKKAIKSEKDHKKADRMRAEITGLETSQQELKGIDKKEEFREKRKNYVSCEDLIGKLEDLNNTFVNDYIATEWEDVDNKSEKVAELSKATKFREMKAGEKERAKRLLERRMEYARKKVEDGMVNFGKNQKDRIDNQYKLLEVMATAGVSLNIEVEGYQDEDFNKIREGLKKMEKVAEIDSQIKTLKENSEEGSEEKIKNLEIKRAEIAKAQSALRLEELFKKEKEYKNLEKDKKFLEAILVGASFSASFGVAGWGIRHFADQYLFSGEKFGSAAEEVKKYIEESWFGKVGNKVREFSNKDNGAGGGAKEKGLNLADFDNNSINESEFEKLLGETEIKDESEIKEKNLVSQEIKDVGSPVENKEQEESEEIIKISPEKEITIDLQKEKLPLERVFQMAALDKISESDIMGSGDNIFGEEEMARSLNISQNLIRLAEGGDTAGVAAKDAAGALEYDKIDDKLIIKNSAKFEDIVNRLNGHSKKLWEEGRMKGPKGAVGYIDNISHKTWQNIVSAKSLEDEGIAGKDDLADQINKVAQGADQEVAKTQSAQAQKARQKIPPGKELFFGRSANQEIGDKIKNIDTETETEITLNQKWGKSADGYNYQEISLSDGFVNPYKMEALLVDIDKDGEADTLRVLSESGNVIEETAVNKEKKLSNLAKEYINLKVNIAEQELPHNLTLKHAEEIGIFDRQHFEIDDVKVKFWSDNYNHIPEKAVRDIFKIYDDLGKLQYYNPGLIRSYYNVISNLENTEQQKALIDYWEAPSLNRQNDLFKAFGISDDYEKYAYNFGKHIKTLKSGNKLIMNINGSENFKVEIDSGKGMIVVKKGLLGRKIEIINGIDFDSLKSVLGRAFLKKAA